jgi:Protein of unknown function (DUF3563)
MTSFLSSLMSLLDFSPTSIQDRDAKYLAESADICDLERRMRQLESGDANLCASGPYAIFMR